MFRESVHDLALRIACADDELKPQEQLCEELLVRGKNDVDVLSNGLGKRVPSRIRGAAPHIGDAPRARLGPTKPKGPERLHRLGTSRGERIRTSDPSRAARPSPWLPAL
jgi:hypothetical protein